MDTEPRRRVDKALPAAGSGKRRRDPPSGGSRWPRPRRPVQHLDHHQRRRRTDRRQAHGHPGAARDPDRVSSFLNIRVRDIHEVYAAWSARGAQFLTPPKQHEYEIRCYIRDPDGYLIEVGQTTDPEGDWTPAQWPSAAP